MTNKLHSVKLNVVKEVTANTLLVLYAMMTVMETSKRAFHKWIVGNQNDYRKFLTCSRVSWYDVSVHKLPLSVIGQKAGLFH